MGVRRVAPMSFAACSLPRRLSLKIAKNQLSAREFGLGFTLEFEVVQKLEEHDSREHR
jgi:hypothetical protein